MSSIQQHCKWEYFNSIVSTVQQHYVGNWVYSMGSYRAENWALEALKKLSTTRIARVSSSCAKFLVLGKQFSVLLWASSQPNGTQCRHEGGGRSNSRQCE